VADALFLLVMLAIGVKRYPADFGLICVAASRQKAAK